MPYLLYPPGATETTKPTYAVGLLDPVDEIIIKHLREWGWSVEEMTRIDPKWLAAIQDYHARMQRPSDEEGVTSPSLWEYWRDENARRVALRMDTTKGRGKLTKSPRTGIASSHRSLSSLFRSKGAKEPTGAQDAQPLVEENRNSPEAPSPKQERKTIAQLRQETMHMQRSEDWNAPNPPRSLGRPNPGHSNICVYQPDERTSSEVHTQPDEKLEQEITDWVGTGGILQTIQFSVHSEEGICVNDKGEKGQLSTKNRLGLFDWEQEMSWTSSTKSKDPSGKGSLECVPAELSAVFDAADRYQEKDGPGKETHKVE